MSSEADSVGVPGGNEALTGAALDLAVAQAVRLSPRLLDGSVQVNGLRYAPSRDWADGGPLIERYRIRIQVIVAPWVGKDVLWSAEFPAFGFEAEGFAHGWSSGPTPLVAAMRALVEARSMYREVARDGRGWETDGARNALALVVELVRLAGQMRQIDFHEVHALAHAAQQGGAPLTYRFDTRSDGPHSRRLSDDLAHLVALDVLRVRTGLGASGKQYEVTGEARNYLQGFRDLLSLHAGAVRDAVRQVVG